VLGRGKLPCDVLFLGEAPGQSEDVIGIPFAGPAGHLLDMMIDKVMNGLDLRIAFTNLIACIPKDESGDKVNEPEIDSINACQDRLIEFLLLARPKLVIFVGNLSAKHATKLIDCPSIEVTHPAAILRSDISVKSLLIQRVTVQIADAVAELV
jgi:DNA polymerase